MKNIRLIGNFGKYDGIVIFRNHNTSCVWVVTLDQLEPTNLSLAKLKYQVK